ncbi:Uncharacterized protein Fot_27769 [Forsythia ovata]|uniref:Uncharacterized protein n=1 Tax=Forsythia ovata TaxID=205694 RepID=A0ABD1TML1_9LAMI
MDEGSDVGFISGAANSSTSCPLSSTVKRMLFESPGQSTPNKRPIEKHVTTEIETLSKITPKKKLRLARVYVELEDSTDSLSGTMIGETAEKFLQYTGKQLIDSGSEVLEKIRIT